MLDWLEAEAGLSPSLSSLSLLRREEQGELEQGGSVME